MPERICSIEGCSRPARSRGWCAKHYMRWWNHGDPTVVLTALGQPAEDRFWAKVNKDGPVPAHRPELGPCWIWTGSPSGAGYGQFHPARVSVGAHRFAWDLLVGSIPAGLQPDHLCRVRRCVKAVADEHGPAHLEIVTPRENTLRGESFAALNAAKTHCIHGHEFTPQNTRVASDGSRHCRECHRRWTREWKTRRALRDD